jgi:hypothetical protein
MSLSRRFTVALVITGVAAGALIICTRHFQRRSAFAERTACVGNLVLLKLAKEVYAQDHNLTNGAVVPEAAIWQQAGKRPQCFSGGSYSINTVGELPTCSYTGIVAGRVYRHHM